MKKVVFKILVVWLIVIFILQFNVMVFADEITDLQNEQESNEKKIQEVEEQKKQVTQEKSEALQQVEEIQNQIADYENQINELDTKITNLNIQIQDAENKIKIKQEDYDKQQELLEKRLVATYELGETSFLDVLLSSKNIVDLISNYYYISQIAEADMDLMEKIENEKKEIEETKTTLEQNKQELNTSKTQKESMSVQLQNAKAEKDKYVAKLSTQEQALQKEIDDIEEANKSIDIEIQKKQEEIKKILEQQQQQQQQQKPNTSGGTSSEGTENNPTGGTNNSNTSTGGGSISDSGFIYPVPNTYSKITTYLYYSSGQYHGAVDFGSSGINGQPVYAVADGVVVTAKALNYSYGNYVIIAHANGLYTLYAHGQQGSIRVSEYQEVKQGQQIMNVGSTGNSSGPHLHFEVRTSPGLYENRVNPLNYLP